MVNSSSKMENDKSKIKTNQKTQELWQLTSREKNYESSISFIVLKVFLFGLQFH